jgi:hypothetical protein
LQPLIDLLLSKVEELNYRARELSLQCLMKLVQHPQIDHKYLVTKIIEPIAKTPFEKAP